MEQYDCNKSKYTCAICGTSLGDNDYIAIIEAWDEDKIAHPYVMCKNCLNKLDAYILLYESEEL